MIPNRVPTAFLYGVLHLIGHAELTSADPLLISL